MPRGRAGLDLIPPARVAETFKRVYSWRDGPSRIAAAWFVSERTVRRWKKTGLPLCYGNVWITRAEWEAFEQTGAVPKSRLPKPPIAAPVKNRKVSVRDRARTGVDRDVSATRSRTGAAVKWWPMRGRAAR